MSRVVFMGSPAYALPSLQQLITAGHEILLVICQPDKKKGRGQELHSCAIAEFARQNSLPLYQPFSLRNEKQQCLDLLKKLDPEFICCVAYGQIIPSEILDFGQAMALNAHGSLLPKWRGAAPINWSLLKGETEQGVTIQKIVPQLDAGPVIWQKSFFVIKEQTSYLECLQRLSEISAEGFVESLRLLNLKPKTVALIAQPPSSAPYASKLSKDSALLYLQNNPEANLEAINQALAPMSYLSIKIISSGELIQVLKIKKCDWRNETLPTFLASQKVNALWPAHKRLFLLSQAQLYEVQLLQKQGKNAISGRDFINSSLKGKQILTTFEWNKTDAS